MIDVTLTGFNGEIVDVLHMPYVDKPPLWIKRPTLAGPMAALATALLGFTNEDDDIPALPMGVGEPALTFNEEIYTLIGDGIYRRTS